MTLIEHGELVRRALEYVQEERCRRPDAPLSSLLDEAGMRFNLTPLDAAQLARFFPKQDRSLRPVQTLTCSPTGRCPMPSLLQSTRYLKKSPNLFVLAVGVLLTLILISRAVQMRELFLGLDLGILDTVLLFGYMTPLFLMLVIPIACMLSVFLTFLRMSTDRELVALRAGGINIYQMLPAPLLFSVICMLLTLWVSLHWLAWGMGHFRETILEIANTRARVVVQPGVFNTDFPNLVLFARQVNPGDGDMSQVLVDDRSHPERHMTILAPEGRFDTDTERGELVFLLEDGKIYTTDKKGSSVLAFDEYKVRLPLDSLFKSLDLGDVRPREMSWSKLSSITREEALKVDANYATSWSGAPQALGLSGGVHRPDPLRAAAGFGL